jgi:hypothetical protein
MQDLLQRMKRLKKAMSAQNVREKNHKRGKRTFECFNCHEQGHFSRVLEKKFQPLVAKHAMYPIEI